MSSVMSKEKIVALTLDIEDKEKVIVLLERKVELARSQLNDLDDNVSQRFQRVTQVSFHLLFERKTILVADNTTFIEIRTRQMNTSVCWTS